MGLFNSGSRPVPGGKLIAFDRLIFPGFELRLAVVLTCFAQQPVRVAQLVEYLRRYDTDGGIIVRKGGKRTREPGLPLVKPRGWWSTLRML